MEDQVAIPRGNVPNPSADNNGSDGGGTGLSSLVGEAEGLLEGDGSADGVDEGEAVGSGDGWADVDGDGEGFASVHVTSMRSVRFVSRHEESPSLTLSVLSRSSQKQI